MNRQPLNRLIAVAVAAMGVLAVGVLYRVGHPPGPVDTPTRSSEPVAPAWWSPTNSPQHPPQIPASSATISADDWPSLRIGERIEFTLPSSERFVGVVNEERQGRVATSFSGNLEVDQRFHFTLTAGPSARFGTINTPVGVFEVATADGVTWVYPRDALRRDAVSVESDVVALDPPLVLEEPPEIAPPPILGADHR